LRDAGPGVKKKVVLSNFMSRAWLEGGPKALSQEGEIAQNTGRERPYLEQGKKVASNYRNHKKRHFVVRRIAGHRMPINPDRRTIGKRGERVLRD